VALVPSFVALVPPLAWTMRAPSFQSFLTLLTGWIFAPRRTVAAMLVASGVAGARHHAAYYRVFSAASWSLDQLGLILFRLLVPLLDAHPPVKLTLERRARMAVRANVASACPRPSRCSSGARDARS
jgi:hypothetical protein